MKKIKVEKDSVEESYRWAYGWRVVDGKYLAFKEWWWRKTKHGNKVN